MGVSLNATSRGLLRCMNQDRETSLSFRWLRYLQIVKPDVCFWEGWGFPLSQGKTSTLSVIMK